LRVAAFQDLDRVLFNHDVRVDAMTFDDPLPALIRRPELWHKNGSPVEQRCVIGDADHAAPGALAVREDIAIGRRVLVDERGFPPPCTKPKAKPPRRARFGARG
jgi:hypothetical protein